MTSCLTSHYIPLHLYSHINVHNPAQISSPYTTTNIVLPPITSTVTSQSPSTKAPPLKQGTYMPRQPANLRSPCLGINTLANHGFIARPRRNVRSAEIHAALGELGLASVLATCFSYPPFLELHTGSGIAPPTEGWWSIIGSPFAFILRGFAWWNPGQVDVDGIACMNLNPLGSYNVMRNDVSMARFGYAQGDNHTSQRS